VSESRLPGLSDFIEACALCHGDGCSACEQTGVVPGVRSIDRRLMLYAWLRDRTRRPTRAFVVGLVMGAVSAFLWLWKLATN
jgi:hypothetical protein